MDKKNTLLLTVIAVATLLVAIVGATFAYFTAQLGGGKEVPIRVETKTVDTTTFAKFGAINIQANQENFADTKGSLKSETSGYVSFAPTNADGDEVEETRNYCYKVDLEISSNNFVYSLPKTHGVSQNTNYPELVLNIWKHAGANSESDLTTIDSGDSYLYKQTFLLNDDKNVVYEDSILTDTTVCPADGSKELTSENECESNQTIKGYDITIAGNDKLSDGTTETDLHSVKTIQIPFLESFDSLEDYQGKDFTHKITATKGSSTVYDLWKVAVTFVNYSDKDIYSGDSQALTDWKNKHQNSGTHYADQQDNTGKTLDATLKFTPTVCPGA